MAQRGEVHSDELGPWGLAVQRLPSERKLRKSGRRTWQANGRRRFGERRLDLQFVCNLSAIPWSKKCQKPAVKRKAFDNIQHHLIPILYIEACIIDECSNAYLMYACFPVLGIINPLKHSTYDEVVKEYSYNKILEEKEKIGEVA